MGRARNSQFLSYIFKKFGKSLKSYKGMDMLRMVDLTIPIIKILFKNGANGDY